MNEEKLYLCPVCNSEDIYWQLSGSLTCNTCNLIYKCITKETINEPNCIEEAKEVYRRQYLYTIRDTGDRREFNTGAVRDMAEGKGRCDLLPACALLRLSKHYEAGAKKYADRNWEKGIPISVMIDSGLRHLLKYLDGQIDEDHLSAAAWNILGAMWMEEKKSELQDIPTRVENMSYNDK